MRSLIDRMTNPTPQDLDVSARIQMLGRADIGRMVDHLGMALDHLAAQREDLTVTRTKDDTSWTIRVEMKPIVASPIVLPAQVDRPLTDS